MTPQTPQGAALSDADYLLALIDTTFETVPEVKRHHERMRAIARRLTAEQPVAYTARKHLPLLGGDRWLAARSSPDAEFDTALYARAPVTAEQGGAAEQMLGLLAVQADELREALDELAPDTIGNLVQRVRAALTTQPQAESADAELRKAAQAVVDRWDTPLWKDAPFTGDFISRLRKALATPTPPTEPT